MTKRRLHLAEDLIIIIASIVLAVLLVKTGVIADFISLLSDKSWLGVFLGGMFFTSIFTTGPSIALLGELAQTTSLPVLAILGGIGAALGDYVIFRFVRDRVSQDIMSLLSVSRKRRAVHLIRARLFRYFIPFLGGLVIASPLPDELGIAMLGISKMKSNVFLMISFVFNAFGILMIGWIARILAGN